MAGTRVLQAKQINHGQSEIWLAADGNELTPHRTLATNEVVNVVRRHTAEDAFKAFHEEYHVALEHVATLSAGTIDAIASELKLQS
jgi:hypothetical protein